MLNKFKEASKNKLRFVSNSMSNLTVESLWDLPLESTNKSSLDGIYKLLKKSIKDSEGESFLSKTTSNVEDELRLSVLEEIMTERLAENKSKVEKRANQSKLDLITRIRTDREEKDLLSMSEEDLTKLEQSLQS